MQQIHWESAQADQAWNSGEKPHCVWCQQFDRREAALRSSDRSHASWENQLSAKQNPDFDCRTIGASRSLRRVRLNQFPMVYEF